MNKRKGYYMFKDIREKAARWIIGADLDDTREHKMPRQDPGSADFEFPDLGNAVNDNQVYVLLYGDNNEGSEVVAVTRGGRPFEDYIKEHFSSLQKNYYQKGQAIEFSNEEKNEETSYWRVYDIAYQDRLIGVYWTVLQEIES